MFGRMANTFRGLLGLILGVGQPAQATPPAEPPPATEAGRPTAEAPRPVTVQLSSPLSVKAGVPTTGEGEWPDLLLDGSRFDPAPPPSHRLPQIIFAGGDDGDPFCLDLGLTAAR